MTAQSIWRTDFKSLTFWKPFSARPWLDNPWIKDPILYYICISIPQRTAALAQKSFANKFKNSNGSTPGQSRRVANLTCVESSWVEFRLRPWKPWKLWKPEESQAGGAQLQTEIGTPDVHLLTAECILNNAYTPPNNDANKKCCVNMHLKKLRWVCRYMLLFFTDNISKYSHL